jgi:homoserine dehydrogenase
MAGRGRQLLRFEAAVAGAIPIIQGLSGGLAANRLGGLFGIINGTCNYIFGEMEANGTAFDEVLAEAQRLGYAEADPSFDIDGIDAAHKLTILLALGFTGSFDLSAVFVEGIRHVTVADIRFAQELGFKIKHLGIIQNTDAGVEARVHCALVPGDALLANVNGVMNAVQINSDGAGETLFSGPGAGGEATASAVLSDVLALGALMASGNGIGVPSESDQSSERLSDQPALVSMSDVSCANYLRIPTVDQPGVFAQVTQALSEFSISIDAAIQHEASSNQSAVDIVLLTDDVVEGTMNAALERLQRLDIVAADIVRLRVAPTL